MGRKARRIISAMLAAMLIPVMPVAAAQEAEEIIAVDESTWTEVLEQHPAEMEQFRAEQEDRLREMKAENARRRETLGISEDGVHPARPAEPVTAQDGVTLMSADGTYSEVVYIETVEELLAVDGHKNGYYELMNDLDISGMDWKPLNLSGGVFNGNGYTISGMTITESCEGDIGFFGSGDYYTKSAYVYDLNLDNINIDIDVYTNYWGASIVSAMGLAYADTCSVEGNINIDVTGLYRSLSAAAISGGTDCFADVDINVTGTVQDDGYYVPVAIWRIYGLDNCVNSIGYVNVNVTAPACSYTGISDCVNCELYGDAYVCSGETVYDEYGDLYAVYGSENCVYIGNIKTVNIYTTNGIHSSDSCMTIGDITTIVTPDMQGENVGHIYAMGGTTNCTIRGNISSAEYCFLMEYISNCSVYGDISAKSFRGMNYCRGCSIIGNIVVYGDSNGTTYGIYGGSANYINGNFTVDDGEACGISFGSNHYISGNVVARNGRATGMYSCDDSYIKGNVVAINGTAIGMRYGSGNYLSGVAQSTKYGLTVSASRSANYGCIVECNYCGKQFAVHATNNMSEIYNIYGHCTNKYGDYYVRSYEMAYYDYNFSSSGSGASPEEPAPPEASYAVQIIDAQTGEPLAGAVVTIAAKNYTTDANGVATLSKAPVTGGLKVEYGGAVVLARSDFHPVPDQVNVVYVNGLDIDADDFFAGNNGSAGIKGPTANIFGKQINIFEFPFGFEFDFFDICEVAYDKDKKVYQVICSMGEDDDSEDNGVLRDANDESWITSFQKVQTEFELAKNQTLSIGYDLSSVPGKLGPDGSLSAALFLELKPEGMGLRIVSSGAYVKFEGEYKGGMPLPSMPAVYLAYGVTGEMLADAKLELEKATLIDPKLNLVADITAELTPYIGVGVGVQEVLSIEAGLKGKLEMELNLPAKKLSENLQIDLTGQVYILGTILWMKAEYVKDFLKIELYPNPGVELMTLKDINDYSVIDRSYLNAAMPMLLAADTVKNGVYPYGGVKTGALSDGRVIMVWIDDDTSRNLVNKTALYYSILENGRWSAPTQIENDGTADFDFDLCVYENNAALVWQDARTKLEESASLEDMAPNIELSYAEFDGERWSAPITVTSGISDYEYSPRLYYDGDAYIAWKQNNENSVMPGTGGEKVYSVSVSEGSIGAVQTEYEEIPLIYGLAVGSDGSVAVIADVDGDISTAGSVLYVDGLENYKSDTVLSGLDYNEGFCFTENGSVQRAQEYGSYPKILFEGVSAEKIAYITGYGRSAAVYEVQNEYTSNLYASYYEKGTWTNPVPITDFDEKIRSWDAHMDKDGNIIIGAILANIVIENEKVNDTARLVYTTTEPIEDIAVNAVSANGSVTPGKVAEFIVNVTNNTKKDITSVNITLGGEDVRLLDGVQTVNIPAGASANIAVNVLIPEDFDAQTLTADISVPGLTEKNENNNTASGEFGAGNLEVELKGSKILSDGTAEAVIKNTGCADVTDAVLTVTGENGEEIYTGKIGTVAGGETKKIKFTLDSSFYAFDGKYDSFAITAAVESSGDALQFDNEDTYCIRPQDVEIISFAQPQEVMSVGDTYSPKLNVYPKNIETEVYLVSDNESVAVVENGVITAVDSGKATITAMVPGTAMTAKMTVYVRDLTNMTAPVITAVEYHDFSDNYGIYGMVIVSVDLRDCLMYGETQRMIIAVYAEDDSLIGISTGNVSAKEYDGIYIQTQQKKPKYVKVFIWNSVTGMEPASLAAVKEITVIE